MKKFLTFLAASLAALSIGCGASPAPLPFRASAPLETVVKIDDYPVWTMKLRGGYDLGEILERGIASYDEARRHAGDWYGCDLSRSCGTGMPGKACTGFTATAPDGDRLFCHNEDWEKGEYLVLFLTPTEGYPSVNVVDVRDGDSRDGTHKGFLAAALFPLAGMNSRGLAVSTYSVPSSEPPETPGKPNLIWPVAIRMLLDRAATVDEALALLDSCNILIEEGNELQFLVGDSSGDSAVVEWLDGKTVVVRKDRPWQAVTNFVLHGASERDFSECSRYVRANGTLEASDGILSGEAAMRILEAVSVPGATQFSVVFDLSRGTLTLVFGRRYEKPFQFSCADCPPPSSE